MKTIRTVVGMVGWLLMNQAMAQPGLKGEYYNGTNLGRNVLTRVDPQLDFTWENQSPAPGVDRSYYSVRWTGKLLAPASGRYTLYACRERASAFAIGRMGVHFRTMLSLTGPFSVQKWPFWGMARQLSGQC